MKPMTKMYAFAAMALLMLCTFNHKAQAQISQRYTKIPIAFYNLENLFDTVDQENKDEEYLPNGQNHWTMEKYQEKLSNMAKVISGIAGHGPAILGVSEIENRGVLEDLVKEPALKSLNYDIIHYDSPDLRGIDCAILYRPDVFQVLSSGVRPVHIPEDPNIKTRDITYATGVIDGEVFHILVGHWPSRSGGESASMHRRMAAAKTMKSVADSLLNAFPNSKTIMMGDFNDDPICPSVTRGLGVVESNKNIKDNEYFSPMINMYKNGKGTLAYRDVWNLFDIIAINGSLCNGDPYQFHIYEDKKSGESAFIYKQNFMLQRDGKYKGYPLRTMVGGSYQGGYSDHFPVYLYLIKKR